MFNYVFVGIASSNVIQTQLFLNDFLPRIKGSQCNFLVKQACSKNERSCPFQVTQGLNFCEKSRENVPPIKLPFAESHSLPVKILDINIVSPRHLHFPRYLINMGLRLSLQSVKGTHVMIVFEKRSNLFVAGSKLS